MFVGRGWVGHCGCFVFASLTQIITDSISVPHTSLHFCFHSCLCESDRKCERERRRKSERKRGGGGDREGEGEGERGSLYVTCEFWNFFVCPCAGETLLFDIYVFMDACGSMFLFLTCGSVRELAFISNEFKCVQCARSRACVL